MLAKALVVLFGATLVLAKPLHPRQVSSLDQASFEEAQERDPTATRALSNVNIKTSSGQCLFVDELSGDFRANLTPIQLADCGSTKGQGWDVITSGKHNDQPGQALVVSTLTQACFNFDPRRPAGNQVLLFSCGGRADGGGDVTDSQLFAFDGGAGPLSLVPKNGEGQCLTASGGVVDVAACKDGDQTQSFTFGGGEAQGNFGGSGSQTTSPVTTSISAGAPSSSVAASQTTTEASSTGDAGGNGRNAVPTANPTTAVPVLGSGGTLDPQAVSEAQAFDSTAKRPLQSVNIRAPDGRCLSIDPTAGDFRENLIPVALASCNQTPNQKWDIVTRGKHNDGSAGEALLVNVLTNGCISFDGRRTAGDTVTLFSCGGRADGEGETDFAQLYPFDGTKKLVLEPANGNGQVCLIAGDERLDSTSCSNDGSQVFDLVTVL